MISKGRWRCHGANPWQSSASLPLLQRRCCLLGNRGRTPRWIGGAAVRIYCPAGGGLPITEWVAICIPAVHYLLVEES
eukprot:scaffold42005_cov365-Skeletonema_marinoi.AAC.1